ncbi:MAG: 16S rRNA (guanine(966)-N(2))-methyltransferase RsmD [Gammaproteobacteria bacterium]|nr:16S rRNA (guanine(966)-N(2))-methyltransferase RsmD [Gammaproteobacteria bacterium]
MAQGEIRIIGGQWRGRKLKVPELPGLRPTPDRVRETLFNWLAPIMPGAYCLDLFAGSGALGIEALSRGAAEVVLVDQAKMVVDQLRQQLVTLGAKNAEVYQAKVPTQLKSPARPFDVVFLDPPFQDNLLLPTCFYLEENGFLADNATIYLEAKEAVLADQLPANWTLTKTKKAGQVVYHLALRKTQ